MQALDLACALFDGQHNLATAIGCKSASISGWRERGIVPEDRCEPIEAATHGEVRVEDLRPTLLWRRNAVGEVVGIEKPIKPTPRPRKVRPSLTPKAGSKNRSAIATR